MCHGGELRARPEMAVDARLAYIGCMLFDSPADAELAETISKLAFCNPFLPERIELERTALGPAFVEVDTVWNVAKDWEGNRPNIGALQQKVESLAGLLRDKLVAGASASDREL